MTNPAPPPGPVGPLPSPVQLGADLAGAAVDSGTAAVGDALVGPINTWMAGIQSGLAHTVNVILNNIFYWVLFVVGVLLMLAGFYLLLFSATGADTTVPKMAFKGAQKVLPAGKAASTAGKVANKVPSSAPAPAKPAVDVDKRARAENDRKVAETTAAADRHQAKLKAATNG